VIKRFRFAATVEDIDDAIEQDTTATAEPVPTRIVRCVALAELTPPDAPCAAIAVEWFPDDVTPADETGTVVAEEVVVRGADWLEQRWRDGGPRWKHMALARRHPDLSQEELSRRWRSHAGTAGTLVIPDVARGQAYAQDHPVRPGPYDAVNEVWFDDPADLRARVEWFAAPRPPDELFAESWLLAVREEVVGPLRYRRE
jgi:hypothetical protein